LFEVVTNRNDRVMLAMRRRSLLRLGAVAVAYATVSSGQAKAAPTGLNEADVKDYGATGDGTADETAAIHAARDAAGIGGRVVISAGSYLVSGLTANVANQTWELSDHAVIKMEIGAKEILLITADGVSVLGGVFDGCNGTAHDGSQLGVKVLADGVSFSGVTVQNSPFKGILFLNSSQVTVSKCTFLNCYADGIWVENSLTAPSDLYDITITDNLIDGSSAGDRASGIGIYGGTSYDKRLNRVIVRGNTVILPYNQSLTNTGGVGLYNARDAILTNNVCIGGFIGISCPNMVRSTIANNTVRGFKRIGIELPVAGGEINNVTVSGNVVDPDGAAGNAGIQTSNGNIASLSIVGNSIRNFSAACNLINFGSGSVLKSINLAGNILASSVGSNQFMGVVFNGPSVTGLSMSGNTIDADSSTNSYGVNFFKGVTGASITGNQFSNLETAAVNMGASSSSFILDYITVTGNNIVNCGALLRNETSGGAVVGTNIATEYSRGFSTTATAGTMPRRPAPTR